MSVVVEKNRRCRLVTKEGLEVYRAYLYLSAADWKLLEAFKRADEADTLSIAVSRLIRTLCRPSPSTYIP